MSSDGKKPLDQKLLEEKANLDIEGLFEDEDAQKELEQRKRDVAAIQDEAKSVKKDAEGAAEKAQPGERPVVAGFDTIDDHLTSYAKKYKTDDLGFGTVVPSGKPATTAKQVLGEPDSNGASPEIERLLAEKRKEVGYETFENFRPKQRCRVQILCAETGSQAV